MCLYPKPKHLSTKWILQRLVRIGCDDLTAHSLDKHRTDPYRKISRATRTTVALAKAIDKYDAATESEYKPQFKVLRQLEEAKASLELAAWSINEGIATIIDPRKTLEHLEKEERRRKLEKEAQEEKEKEACPRKKLSPNRTMK
ncbi:hypothetical protein PsorP6_012309 [Peronosclerospora sorghi]|uniref:Uncharacterized protein n=1 Tax=Peronosclerospora sorghi TaxID=230839 RepID=A0ACC0WHT0_9STRA|nr:hypothetical protein PsorP6_012309 [Peronosclerospora sorghi]